MPNPLTLLLLTATVALTQGAFIISPSGPASTLAALTGPQHACLDYRGTYGSFSVHVVRDWDGCAGTVEEVPGAKFMEEEKGEGRRLVVVERADLETSDLNAARNQWREAVVRAISTRDDRISRFTNQNPIEPIPLGLASDIALVHEEPGRMLLFVPLSALDALVGWLPRETEVVPLPEFTVKPADTLPADHPIIKILRKLRYDERVADIVSKVNVTRLEEDVTYLSGERKDSPLRERTATSADALLAARWIEQRFYDFGCDTTTLFRFRKGFSPNVICTFFGKKYPDELVILGAHYDSRGTRWGPRAPGADDDGSGTSMLLQSAHLIHQHSLSFDRTLQLVAFSGEEQGLFGSRAYARHLRDRHANVTVMLQGDMLAYRREGEPMQCGFPERFRTEEVTVLVRNVTQFYVPELTIGITGACCSDHQSFWENGFASTQFFERNGPIVDPMYHNSGDLVYRSGYDLEQLAAITKAMLSSILHIAEFTTEKERV